MIEYIINCALKDNKKIDIIYMGEKEITVRQIKPIRLTGDILEAYCYMRNAVRHFRLESILSASFQNDIYKKVG